MNAKLGFAFLIALCTSHTCFAGVAGNSYTLQITQTSRSDPEDSFTYGDRWTFNLNRSVTVLEALPDPEIYSELDLGFFSFWQASAGRTNLWQGISLGSFLIGTGSTSTSFGKWFMTGFRD